MTADPYRVLGVDVGSSEDEIRRRYLELVRRHSPERDPDRFAEVREAYEQLRSPLTRMKNRLFPEKNADSLDAIIGDVQDRLRDQRIPTETLLSLAQK